MAQGDGVMNDPDQRDEPRRSAPAGDPPTDGAPPADGAQIEGVPPAKKKKPYEPPRVLTDEAFEQLSLACTTKMGTKKNFT
jgi:hypothetical protein